MSPGMFPGLSRVGPRSANFLNSNVRLWPRFEWNANVSPPCVGGFLALRALTFSLGGLRLALLHAIC